MHTITIGTPHNGDIEAGYMASVVSAMQMTPHNVKLHLQEGCFVHQNRNRIFDTCDTDYLLFVDSDMVFSPQGINDLLKHKKDIIGGLYFHRNAPHLPLAGHRTETGGTKFISEIPDEVFEVDSIGTGFLLISRNVMDEMKIEAGKDKPFDLRRLPNGTELGEDMAFCLRAKEKGFSIWCDPNIAIGHITKQTITRNDFLAYKEFENSKK
jgi:GT2 family glycosyltransferase